MDASERVASCISFAAAAIEQGEERRGRYISVTSAGVPDTDREEQRGAERSREEQRGAERRGVERSREE